MENKFEELKKKVNKALEQMQIYVTDINIHSEGNLNFLTIELDKLGGLDLDTIVEASNIVNPIVDELDFIEDSYILDIISRERNDNNE